MSILIPDVSEFQANVDWARLNKWNGGHAIIRAAYGSRHVDRAWYTGERRADFWRHGGKTLGIYQYLVASQSAATQARALAKIVGKLRRDEYLICDLEEGSGNQHARWIQWHDTLVSLGYSSRQLWLYSGEYFYKVHGLVPIANSATHTWVAAYQRHEPSDVAHSLWQYTNTAVVPGISGHVDCSQFDGSLAAWLTLVTGTKPVPAPRPKPTPAPVIRHPFAKLKTDGDLGPITISALNYWLGDKQGTHMTTKAILALQHKVGSAADGEWGRHNCALHDATCKSDTTHDLQHYLVHRGGQTRLRITSHLDIATIKGLQSFLNKNVGHYA